MENTIPVSRTTCLSPKGYVYSRGYGFLENWGLHAVAYNPELMNAMKRCNHPGADVPPSVEGAPVECAAFWGMYLIGLAFCSNTFPREEILRAGNELVQSVEQARGEDGYLGSHELNDRLGGDGSGTGVNWDVWGQYLAIYGLLQWHKATGCPTARKLALEGAEVCIRHFEHRPYTAGFDTVATSLGHVYALLYQETGEEKYLAEAMRILEKEWPVNGDWLREIEEGKECFQFKLNRWEILHCILLLGTLYEITGEPRFFNAFERVWWNVVKTNRQSTGGITKREMLVSNPYEAGATETCCCIAWIAYSLEYLRYSKNSYVADEIELTYYNAVLGALMDGLRTVSYDNPMEGYRVKSQIHLPFNYNAAAPDMNCCQANACRGVGEVSRWASMTDDHALYLNYYSPCAMQTQTPSGQPITLHIQGDYPVSGHVRVTVEGLAKPEKFVLMLRIPCWSGKTGVVLNGIAQTGMTPGQYFPLPKEWRDGDEVSLALDMTVHFWAGEERFAGRTAVYYGPMLMAYDMSMNDYQLLPDTVLHQEALHQAAPAAGDGVHCWVTLDIETTSGKNVRLVDYASAGKNAEFYTTWQRVITVPKPLAFSAEGMPVWINRG